ncbi:MAG TPA: nucleoside hydrolase-like domain-containing protein [Mucilaginibacter sp.]|jgi:hypothetical protein
MKKALTIGIIAICLIGIWQQVIAQKINPQIRTIVTTDGEVDDQDSFIRLLMYSNKFHIEGLIYSSSQWHYKGDGKGTKMTSEMAMTSKRYGERTDLRWPGTDWMQQSIDKYALVYKNLIKHDKAYPAPDYLKSIVKIGNIDFEGEMSINSEGSDMIKNILLDNKPGPVYLQIWGGTNTVAKALKSIEDQFKSTPQWENIYKKVSSKAILYAVLDQDATYKKYVAVNWPDIRVMYNSAQFWSFAYAWLRVVPAELRVYLQGKWFAENIKFDHGPLMSSYFLWGDGQKIEGDPEDTQGDTLEAKKYHLGKYDFISEGDSPAFLYLVDVGLRSLEDASYGGWGGRMVQSKTNPHRWEDGKDVTDYNPYTKKEDDAYPQTRWIPVLQNDFAARADWCVKDYKDANHPPVVKLAHSNNLTGAPGAKIELKGKATDPDKNELSYSWWQYKEAGSYHGDVEIQSATTPASSFIIPKDAKSGETIHIILEVSDSGTPKLTRYQRVIVTVK